MINKAEVVARGVQEYVNKGKNSLLIHKTIHKNRSPKEVSSQAN